MILDNLLLFTGSSNGATGGITVAGFPLVDAPTTGAQVSSNIIDLHSANMIPVIGTGKGARDIGIGDDPAMKILVQVAGAFVGGTSLQIAIQGAPDDGTGAPGTFVNWWLSPVYALAVLTAGARLYDMDMPRPPQGVSEPRFLRLSYTSAGTFTTGGALWGAIVLDRFDQFYNALNNATTGGYPGTYTVPN